MNAKRTRNYYDMFAIMFNSQKSYQKYIENTHLGLLTETHEYYFGSLKHQIFIYSRWRHPPKTISPRPYCRSPIGRNGLGSETTIVVSINMSTHNINIQSLCLSSMQWFSDCVCISRTITELTTDITESCSMTPLAPVVLETLPPHTRRTLTQVRTIYILFTLYSHKIDAHKDLSPLCSLFNNF